MAAAASIEAGKEYTIMDWDHRKRFRRVKLLVTGLGAGANTIPHGLTQPNNPSAGAIPREVVFQKTSDITGYETQDADATNLYFTQTAGAGTTLSVYVTV
jgi:hypothetical protein